MTVQLIKGLGKPNPVDFHFLKLSIDFIIVLWLAVHRFIDY